MILAFNTSLADLHIGLFSDDAKPLAEFHHLATPEERHIHDALLAKSTEQLLESIHAQVKDISRIAFINGPGSFTGLRIGLSFAKGLAFGLARVPVGRTLSQPVNPLTPLLAHEVLLAEYSKKNIVKDNLAILYPGYEKNSVYLSFADAPAAITYQPISEVLKMNITEVICTSELDDIQIPHQILNINLQTMAEMALLAKSTNISELEPFYGTDFKPGR